MADVLAETIARTGIQQAVVTEIGDLLPLWKAKVVNLVVRCIRKMVPDCTLPNTIGFRF